MQQYKKNPRIIASIEARMGSSRLPGKVLMNIFGEKALARLVNRLKKSILLTDIVLATSTAPADDVLVDWANGNNIAVYRGSEDDVLSRVVHAQKMMDSDIVVEVTGDCPLVDPEIIDLGINTFFNNRCDVVSNTAKTSFPMGIDVQVFPLAALEWVEKHIQDSAVREHVSLYFYENPEKYNIFHLQAPQKWKNPNLRCVLDYIEDLQFIEKIYERLEPIHGPCFGVGEIVALLKKEPALERINADCKKKPLR